MSPFILFSQHTSFHSFSKLNIWFSTFSFSQSFCLDQEKWRHLQQSMLLKICQQQNLQHMSHVCVKCSHLGRNVLNSINICLPNWQCENRPLLANRTVPDSVGAANVHVVAGRLGQTQEPLGVWGLGVFLCSVHVLSIHLDEFHPWLVLVEIWCVSRQTAYSSTVQDEIQLVQFPLLHRFTCVWWGWIDNNTSPHLFPTPLFLLSHDGNINFKPNVLSVSPLWEHEITPLLFWFSDSLRTQRARG